MQMHVNCHQMIDQPKVPTATATAIATGKFDLAGRRHVLESCVKLSLLEALCFNWPPPCETAGSDSELML